MRSIARIAILLVPIVFVACDDGSGPERRTAESMNFADTDITMDDGDTLQLAPRVYDQNDSIFSTVPGSLELTWSSEDEGVVLVQPDGRAIAMHPGATTVRVEDLESGLFAEADVTVLQVATAATLAVGAGQDGTPGEELADSITVRVVDRHGTGVPGIAVHFRVVSGGGTVGPDSVRTTNNAGFARVRWTLGPEFAQQAMEAEVPGLATPIAVTASMSPVVVVHVDIAGEAASGETLAGALRLDSEPFTHPIGAAHVILSWDPAVLQLSPASITNGDYGRGERRVDNAAGELHLVSSDHEATVDDLLLTSLTFDVVGAPGSSTAIDIAVEQLVRTTFQDVSTESFAFGANVTVN